MLGTMNTVTCRHIGRSHASVCVIPSRRQDRPRAAPCSSSRAPQCSSRAFVCCSGTSSHQGPADSSLGDDGKPRERQKTREQQLLRKVLPMTLRAAAKSGLLGLKPARAAVAAEARAAPRAAALAAAAEGAAEGAAAAAVSRRGSTSGSSHSAASRPHLGMLQPAPGPPMQFSRQGSLHRTSNPN